MKNAYHLSLILAAVVGAGSATGQTGECVDVRVNATKTWTTSSATTALRSALRARKAKDDDKDHGHGKAEDDGKDHGHGKAEDGDKDQGHDDNGIGQHKHGLLLYLQGHLQKSDCAVWDVTVTSLHLKHEQDLWLETGDGQHDAASVRQNADGTTSVRLQARTSSDRDGLSLAAEVNRAVTIQGSVRACEPGGEVIAVNETLTAAVGAELDKKFGKTGSARLRLAVYDTDCQAAGSSDPVWLDADFDFQTAGEIVVPDVLPVTEGRPLAGERAVLEIGNHECGIGNFSGVVRCTYLAGGDASPYRFVGCDGGLLPGARVPGNALSLRVNPDGPGCPGMRTTVSVGVLACGVGAILNPALP